MKKRALKKIKERDMISKSFNAEAHEMIENHSTESSEEIEDLPELDQFFEEAKDRFPLEEMIKQTKFKKLKGSSRSKSGTHSTFTDSCSDSISKTEKSSESGEDSSDLSRSSLSELSFNDVKSVGTEKIYYELEGKSLL